MSGFLVPSHFSKSAWEVCSRVVEYDEMQPFGAWLMRDSEYISTAIELHSEGLEPPINRSRWPRSGRSETHRCGQRRCPHRVKLAGLRGSWDQLLQPSRQGAMVAHVEVAHPASCAMQLAWPCSKPQERHSSVAS